MVFFIVLGLPVGMWAFDVLPERPLKVILGLFMLYVSIKGLAEIYRPHLKAQATRPASGKRMLIFYGLLFCGGIMQGGVHLRRAVRGHVCHHGAQGKGCFSGDAFCHVGGGQFHHYRA